MYWNAQEMAFESFLLYITVTTGYLLVTYSAGKKLTKAQATYISVLFVVFSLYSLWGVGEFWTMADEARLALIDLGPSEVNLNHLRINAAVFAVPMGFCGLLASLKFMKDVRTSDAP